MRRGDAVIAGFAACTSLGYNLESTLAAMGAGLSNFRETVVRDLLGQPAVAARVPLLASGAARADRLDWLLRAGLRDLDVLLNPLDVGHGVPVLLGLPNDLAAEETQRVSTLLDTAATTYIDRYRLFPFGRSGGFAALNEAVQEVRRNPTGLAVVGGVDTLCAPDTMRRLVAAERVLGPGTEGTVPGEAAAFALIASPDHPLSRTPTAVRVEAVALQRAAVPFVRADAVSADGLTAAFQALRDSGSSRVDRVVPAHSGEGYFGRSFSHAYLRQVELMPEPLEVEIIADRVGDIGAASGVIGMAFAAYLMARDGVAGERRALVYTESDSGEVGATVLAGAPAAWERRIPHSVTA